MGCQTPVWSEPQVQIDFDDANCLVYVPIRSGPYIYKGPAWDGGLCTTNAQGGGYCTRREALHSIQYNITNTSTALIKRSGLDDPPSGSDYPVNFVTQTGVYRYGICLENCYGVNVNGVRLNGAIYGTQAYWTSSSGGYWYVFATYFEAIPMWVYGTGETYECPPGTEYNPVTGTCDELPGWVWDPNANGGSGEYVYLTPGIPIGTPIPPGGLPPYYTDDPNNDGGINKDQIPCYVWSEELQVYIYDNTIAGCDGSDCIKAASCIVEPSLDLIPDDIDSILPPGYVDVGSLPGINQPTDSITAGCVKDDSIIECDTEDDVTTKTGCSIIPEC